MKVGILNSGGYNFASITNALQRLGDIDAQIVTNEIEFDSCDKIIIPGVGHAKTAMEMIRSQGLEEVLKTTQKNVLGICLGMQVMFRFSEEGDVLCLDIFNQDVIRLPDHAVSPHMGWNKLKEGKFDNCFVYFANGYYIKDCNFTKSYVDYDGIKMSAIVRHRNFIGCQFHPEKSGKVGERILIDFLYEN